MWCAICNRDLADCICDDLEERLTKAASGGHLVYAVCANCGKHYSRCKCARPNFKVRGMETADDPGEVQ